MVQIKKILVPTDYSARSVLALREALALAERLAASVQVLHVWSAPYFAPQYMDLPVGEGKRSLFSLVREGAEADMQRFVQAVAVPAGVALDSHVESGEPTRRVLEFVREQGIDLVVMATHARTGPARLLLGSIAERIVQLCPCAVLVVRGSDEPTPSG